MVSIQSFPSPRLVAVTRLKIPYYPNILSIAGERRDGFICFPRPEYKVKNGQPSPGFELESTRPFPTMKTVSVTITKYLGISGGRGN